MVINAENGKVSESISVLTLGNWGTALANHLASKGHKVLGWSMDEEVVKSINTNGKNPKCFSNLQLSPNLKATTEIEKALENQIVVIAFPSAALSKLVPKLSPAQENTIFVSGIKGLEFSTNLTPLSFLRKHYGDKYKLAVLSGPSFAVDLVNLRPLGMVAASDDKEIAKKVADIFSSTTLKVYLSDDPLGVELGGIVKNIIAIAAGICDGLSFGESARAGLITRGLAEMMQLAQVMGAQKLTLTGLSGLGDLVMTSTSDTSRNRTVGLRLGRGEKLTDIVSSIGSVAEGVLSTPIIISLADKHKVEMPITSLVGKMLRGEIQPDKLAQELLKRPIRHEI